MSRGRGQGTESGLRGEREALMLQRKWGASLNDIDRVKQMKGLIILAGVPGAGKSTFINKNLSDAVVISTDAYRALAPNSAGEWDQSASRWAFENAFKAAKKELREGNTVVFDSVAVGEKARRDLRELVPSGTEINYVLLSPSVERAKTLNKIRGLQDPMREVPDHVIDRFHNQLLNDADHFDPRHYNHVAIIEPDDTITPPPSPVFDKEAQAALQEILSKGPAALDQAIENGTLQEVFPELAATVGYNQHSKYHDLTLDRHIREVFAHAHAREDDVLKWVALVHDLGKPESCWFGPDGFAHYYRPWKADENHPGRNKESHEVISARNAPKILQRYGLDPATIRDVTTLTREHMFAEPKNVNGMKKLLQRLNGNTALAEKLIDFRECDHSGKGDGRTYNADHLRALLAEAQKPEPKKMRLAIGGKELMAKGLTGFHIGVAIKRLTEDVQEGRVANEPKALLAHFDSISLDA